MKKFIKWFVFLVLIVFVIIGVISTSKKVGAYSISDFGVDSSTTFDDFYTDVNGFGLYIKVKGYYTINTNKEYFVCYAGSSTVVLVTSYIFTSVESYTFDDGFEDVYDDDLTTLISYINNYLLNNTNYSSLLNDSTYYILDNYVGCIGLYDISEGIGLINKNYSDDLYNDFILSFGYLNSTYAYRELINYIYDDHNINVAEIIEDYDIALGNARDEGYSDGYSDGIEGTSEEAFEEGRKVGYTQAIEEGEQITGYVFGLWDTFMNGIRNMFNVNIFGINLSAIILFILSIGVISFVLKRLV